MEPSQSINNWEIQQQVLISVSLTEKCDKSGRTIIDRFYAVNSHYDTLQYNKGGTAHPDLAEIQVAKAG